MMRSPVTWLVCGCAFCWQAPVRADEPKTAEEVVAKYIEAIGGQKAIDSVRTMRLTGKTVGMGGMEMPLVIESKRPDKLRVEFTMQGMTAVQAFDGKIGWFIMPFMGKTDPERMSPDQVDQLKDRADMEGPLVNYKEKGHQVELIGKEELEGSETYKLKLTKKNGDVEYHYLDAEHFLPVKIEGKRPFQGTDIEYELTLGDYKEVGGLLIAHSMHSSAGGMGGSSVTFDKVEVNVDLPDELFAMPEIKTEAATTQPAAEAPDKAEPDAGPSATPANEGQSEP